MSNEANDVVTETERTSDDEVSWDLRVDSVMFPMYNIISELYNI